MSLIITGTIGTKREVSNIIVTEGVAGEVGADELALYALDTVPLYRQNEITNGWIALINFIRDRRLLDVDSGATPPGFRGDRLYSGQDINSMGEGGDRRTASDVSFFTSDDIVVGIGANIAAVSPGLTTPILTAFVRMAQAGREQALKAA